MDFRTLNRRQLQALCKKNKIPANLSNVAMADALTALEFVEGIEEVMRPMESETASSAVELPEEPDVMSSAPRTGRRTAIRNTAKKESEVSQTMTRTSRSTRRMPPDGSDEAKNEVCETPSAPASRRRAAATSVRPKMENLLKECLEGVEDGRKTLNEKNDVPKTPGTLLRGQRREVVKEKSSVRLPVYSTRRSARLAAKQDGSSTQEASENVSYCGSFTVENDEVIDINSKLRALQLDEELEQADSTSGSSSGIESQCLANKELNIVDMHQSSEEFATEKTANGLGECIDATEDLSSDIKESNDVRMDLQEGIDADLQLRCQEVVGDGTKAVPEKLDDDKSEVPNNGEVFEYVAENADALYDSTSVMTENENQGLVIKELSVDMHQTSEEIANKIITNVLGEINERIDFSAEKETNKDEMEGAGFQEVVGDYLTTSKKLDDEDDKHEVPNIVEVPECIVKTVDELRSSEVHDLLNVVDTHQGSQVSEELGITNGLSENEYDESAAGKESSKHIDEMELQESADDEQQPNNNEIYCGDEMLEQFDGGNNETEEEMQVSETVWYTTCGGLHQEEEGKEEGCGDEMVEQFDGGNNETEEEMPVSETVWYTTCGGLHQEEEGKEEGCGDEMVEQFDGGKNETVEDNTSSNDETSGGDDEEMVKLSSNKQQLATSNMWWYSTSGGLHQEEGKGESIIDGGAKFDPQEAEYDENAENILPPVSDDKENKIDTTSGEDMKIFAEALTTNITTGEKEKPTKNEQPIEDLSMRKLRKMLKQLHPFHDNAQAEEVKDEEAAITASHARNGKHKKWRKGGKNTFVVRPALQQVSENSLVVGNSFKSTSQS
ncbi:unnamed protein product [Cuscuta epithymum]|uniref:Uncharacterized protein n=1 Tax=Cuscuta epithymum TaxID=186058 RepID=A0AAV0CC79_9ASTE|nr:unnamed protein product [Cuscuta epithymum]